MKLTIEEGEMDVACLQVENVLEEVMLRRPDVCAVGEPGLEKHVDYEPVQLHLCGCPLASEGVE